MRILSALAVAALALGLTTIGCSADAADQDGASTSSDVTATRETIATDADNGKTIQVTEGDSFVLKLKANATTGYKWKVTDTDRTFAYPSADEYLAPSSSGPVGAGGTQVFTWSTEGVSDAHGTPVVSKIGKHEITVEYRRPWEPATAPAAKTFKLTVEVVAPATQPNNNGGAVESNGQCGDQVCNPGSSCQWCWGAPACVPNGAIC